MKLVITIALLLSSSVLMSQSWRGIYKKKSCFCDNHSNSTGWYLGAGVYGSQLSFQNDAINGQTKAFGYGGFIGNKIKEQFSFRLGAYFGKVQPISVGEEGDRNSPLIEYGFKHLNIPLSLVYKFRSEKRISPYLTLGGEANIVREVESYGDYIGLLEEEAGYNQFNVVLGAGSYILFGDHFGLFVQVSIDMNPFTNESLANYNYAATGKTGLTYHF